jgi:hypothetical protein
MLLFIYKGRRVVIVLCLISFHITLYSAVDTFGITQLYPSKSETLEWHSAHWNNGIVRHFSYDTDPYDPTGWTDDHSAGSEGFDVDGQGVLRMGGEGPRFHINSLCNDKGQTQFFRDVEFTAYFKHTGPSGANWGGMVLGARSGPTAHGSGGDLCDATTYYTRFRNDGSWDFEKEIKHPTCYPSWWSQALWGGNPLPLDRWIGIKYLVYNIENNTRVKLEAYIDTLSNGNPVNGGEWEKVGETVDSGGWTAGSFTGCDYETDAIILEGHGSLLMRTDNDTAYYKMVSIREIETDTPNVVISKDNHVTHFPDAKLTVRQGRVFFSKNGMSCNHVMVRLYNILGQPVGPAIRSGERLPPLSTGLFILRTKVDKILYSARTVVMQ